MTTFYQLESRTRDELEVIAKEQGITGYSSLKKSELALQILKTQAEQEGNMLALVMLLWLL